MRRGSDHGGPQKLRNGGRSSRSLGEGDGEALSDEPDGTEEGAARGEHFWVSAKKDL